MNKPRVYITHSTAFDFNTVLYKPLKSSILNLEYQLIFPHEIAITPINSKEIIKTAAIILAEISYPSTGQGVELGWAETFAKPIICFYQNGKNYSKSLTLLTNKFFSYTDENDLISSLQINLKHIEKTF